MTATMTKRATAEAITDFLRPVRSRLYPDGASVADRLWTRVAVGGPDDCWEWQGGCVNGDGYGQISVGDSMCGVHRAAWIVTNGPIPEGLDVCHSCDNPPCCNPNHLFLGTHTDNMRDMVTKGRANKATGERNGARLHPDSRPRGDAHGLRKHPEAVARGERNGNAKLTAESVAGIRLALTVGGISKAEIARRFGVSTSTVRWIAQGKTWSAR